MRTPETCAPGSTKFLGARPKISAFGKSPVASPAEADGPVPVAEEGPAPGAGAAQPYDQVAAVQYGLLIEAVYSMYYAQPTNPTPPPQPDFPTNFRLLAWVQMNDFTLVETPPQFYGVIAQSVTDSTKFVLALRGTESPIEWFDNLTSHHQSSLPGSRVRLGLLWIQPDLRHHGDHRRDPAGGWRRGARHGFVTGGGKLLATDGGAGAQACACPTARP